MSLPHVRLMPRGPLAGGRPGVVELRARRRRAPGMRSPRGAGQRALGLAGPLLGPDVGLAVELPVGNVATRCPPRGEGYVLCAIQKAWLPAVLLVILLTGLGYGLALLVGELPLVGRRWRRGERPRRDRPPHEPSPALRRDPLLLVATWGEIGDPSADPPIHARRRPGRPRPAPSDEEQGGTLPAPTAAADPPPAPSD